MAAADLLLARRQPQRLDGAHPGQDRLAGVQLDGGYKAFRPGQRRAGTAPELDFKVSAAPGSGKSRLLEVLAAQGAQVLDLEQLAAHRGSVLGGLPSQPQPSQKAFETAIWNACAASTLAVPYLLNRRARRSATCACLLR
jgi:tRNA 2-selenouridine synthase